MPIPDPTLSELKALPFQVGLTESGVVLLERAFWVHAELTDAARLGLSMGEESLTDSLLLHIARALPGRVIVNGFTHAQESRETGADWEWWFGDGPGTAFFGMRVQAKKLKRIGATPGYDFDYLPQSPVYGPRPRQVDRLLSSAAAAKLPAVYALYNGPELDLSQFSWGCCHFSRSEGVMGVALLAGQAARQLANGGRTALTEVLRLSRPWSCMLLCPTFLQRDASVQQGILGDSLLGLYAGDLVAELYAAHTREYLSDDPNVVTTEAQRALNGARPWEQAPAYVRQLATSRVDVIQQVEVPAELGGVVVIQRGEG